jgi:peptidoglycan-associated lipoprotein
VMLLAACETSGNADGSNGGAGYAGENAAPGTQGDLEANVGDRVFFATDSSVVEGEGQGTLDRQSAWLQQNGAVKVVIEGHADERGTREYNLALGERRASAAKSYLASKGIDAARLETTSYGKERPAVVGSNEAAWAQNRRAVTVVK